MEVVVKVKECFCGYKYDKFNLQTSIKRYNVAKDNSDINTPHHRKTKKKIRVYLDGILVHYLVRELKLCCVYRNRFFRKMLKSHLKNHNRTVEFVLLPPRKEIIDYEWNTRIDYMIRERCELDHALSWLSTLGGAFSALGDYYSGCAEIAGKISFRQLHLALRLGDANIVSRCRLYFSLSLIQRGYFKLAKKIILSEYSKAKSATVVDFRLINMCRGIWSKLQYDYKVHRNCKKLSRTKLTI